MKEYIAAMATRGNGIHVRQCGIALNNVIRFGKDGKAVRYRFNHEEEFLDRYLHIIQP